MLQYNPSISGSLSVTGSLIVTNGVIGTVNGVDIQIFSSSISQVVTNIQTATGSQDGRLTSIESFTSSTSARLGSIETISASNLSRIGSLETISASNIARINSLETTSASVDTLNTAQNTRLTNLEEKTGSLATTGSNTFIGTQTITGSLYISSDLIVQGSSSLQNITASAVSIGTNLINLNTANPAIRYAGLSIGDSGSIGGSGSFLYDSVQDEMIFVHRGDSSVVTSSVTLMGPETYDSIGNETYLTTNRLPKGAGNEHLADSNISDTGTLVTINSVTSSFNGIVGIGITNPSYNLDVTGTGRFTGILTPQSGILFPATQTVSTAGSIGFNSTQGLFIYTKTGTSYDFKVYNGVGSTFMQVPTGTQNVEFLGTATVSSDISGKGAFNGYAGATQNLLIDWSGESQVTTLTNTNLFFGTNALRRMTLDASGRLLVGSDITANGARIQTSGDIRADYTSAIYLQINGGADGDYRKGFSGVNQLTSVARGLHIFNYDPDSSQGIKFYGGTYAAKVRFGGFDNGGNFFINATDSAEGYKFYVNGTAGIVGAATFSNSVTAGTYLGVNRGGSDTIGAGPYLVLAQTAGSRQWIQQMGASLTLDYYHYNGSGWIQPLTLAPSGHITMSASARISGPLNVGADTNFYQVLSQDFSYGSGWRELFRISHIGLCTSGRFSLNGTGNSFVHSSQWAWSSTHNGGTGRTRLVQLTGGEYSDVQFSIDVTGAGDIIVNANFGTSYGLNLCVEKTRGGAIDVSNQNADRTSPVSGYARVQTITSTPYGSQFYRVVAETLAGSGNRAVYSDSGGSLTNSSSDVTLKKNVENITYGLNSIMALRPISFNWIPENLGEQKEIGFIAQEVQELIPELIATNKDETLSLDYPKLTAVLTKAIQELKVENDSLKEILQRNNIN
jgi:hypothetical protein